MSQRLVTSKCPYSCSRKVYGALDLIEKNRKKHSQGGHRYSVKKERGKPKKGASKLRSNTRAVNDVSRAVDEREKTKLPQLLAVYGEQNSPAYRPGYDIKDYRPPLAHFPDLATPSMAKGSVIRTSSPGLQDRQPSLSKTQTLTLPDINKKPLV
jgi:hypothetical protein